MFMVIRGDDNGQNFIIADELTSEQATALHQKMLRGHKQWYNIISYTPEERNAVIERYSLKR